MRIELENITKNFGNFRALDSVSITVQHGELLALLGPSGCGKTTLLRTIAGLEFPDSGVIRFDGVDVRELSARERNVGFVFQHYALFRHMTIFDNVAFGLKVRRGKERLSKKEIRERVMELLSLVQLANLETRYPHELSGGQRQRVALARALAVQPRVLLLDEPFGALDAQVRKELRRWLRRLHDEIHITSVFVTHDQEEALEVADRVAILNKGKVEQIGTPDEVYRHPKTAFVLQFMGNVNLFHGRLEGVKGLGYVRPHEIEIDAIQKFPTDFAATVEEVHPLGRFTRVTLLDDKTGQLVEAEISYETGKALGLTAGMKVYYRVQNVQTFDGDYVI
ncbi:MAG: sulfate ABC transporter ATP-binding protein [Turneriella sp.]|nr:sulfate ABC transporter ATP-binding protein [Leptospiraceae bacterium]MCX7633179.1 sulfate ABC transporter ATP-binding protein [Turneriella sp.]